MVSARGRDGVGEELFDRGSPGGRDGGRIGRQPQACQDSSDDGRIRDQGDEAAAGPTLRAFEDVQTEDTFHHLGPRVAASPRERGLFITTSRAMDGPWWFARHHGGPVGRIGSQDAAVGHEVEERRRDEGTELLDEGQGGHENVSGAIAKDPAELDGQPAVFSQRETLALQGRAGYVAAQSLEAGAIAGGDAHSTQGV